MIKTILASSAVIAILAFPVSSVAFAKAAQKEPTGAERQRQYALALKQCRKQSGGVTQLAAVWEAHYGRTGWWCVTRR